MIGRRGFIGLVTGAVAGVLAAARGAFGAARDFHRNQGAFPSFWPKLGETVIITQWFPTVGAVDWRMRVTGISWQVSNEPDDMNDRGSWQLLLAGYNVDPSDIRRTFNLSIRMDQASFNQRPGEPLRIDWWPWRMAR